MKKSYVIMFSVVIAILLLVILLLCTFRVLKFDRSVSIAAIVSLFSTLIAFGALLITDRSTQQSNKNSQQNLEYARKQLDGTLDQNKKAQAVKVAAWINDFSAKMAPDSYGNTLASEITIQNASEIPVYKLFVFTISNKSQQDISKLLISTDELAYVEVLKPGTTKVTLRSRGSAMGGEHESVAMIFDDSQGNTWYRDNFGKLSPVSATQLQKTFTQSRAFGPYSQYQQVK